MPLTIPQFIEVKTAADAPAAYLSPEADGLKDCWVDRELNGRSTLTFSLPIKKLEEIFALTVMGTMPKLPGQTSKWQYLTDQFRIYAGGREYIILSPDAIEKSRNEGKTWGKVTAHESWVKLGKDYVDPGISNDPQTPTPPALAVIILSGGSDLSGGIYTVGSAGHALYALLQGTGWTVGTVDVTGIHDLETEKISRLENINRIQEIWGGYLVWEYVFDGNGNVIERKVHLRDETTWAVYTGYQVRYEKNLKNITRTDDYDIVTKLYPFGADDLDIGSVNGGLLYLSNNTYTAEVLEGIWVNQDIATAQELKDAATKYLAKVCRPRHNYRAKHVDLRTLPGYQHEDYDVGHLADLIDTELGFDDRVRIIGYRYNVFQPWQCELEVGDPIEKIESMLADSQAMVKYLNSIKTSKGQITAYKLVNESIIAEKIAKAAVDATKLNTKTVVLLGDAWTDNSPAAGSVAWNQHKLYYAGVEHVIVAGNTALKHIYWDGVSNTYTTSENMPTLTDGQFIVAVNNGGLHDTVWDKGYARQFIGSALIADAAILSAHIGLAQILDAHIAELSANKIIVTDLTALSSEDGFTKLVGNGLKVFDNLANLRVHAGNYAAGKYGLKIINGEIYSTVIRTGTETDTTYIALVPPDALSVVVNGQETLRIRAAATTGAIDIKTAGAVAGMLWGDVGYDSVQCIALDAGATVPTTVDRALLLQSKTNNVYIVAPSSKTVFVKNAQYFDVDAEFRVYSGNNAIIGGDLTVQGTLDVWGSPKNAVEVTPTYGARRLSVRESPEIRYVDEGKGTMANGECRIDIDPIFLECIEPHADVSPWFVHLTPMANVILYVAEIGATYFVVKESTGMSNDSFAWSLSAVRKGFTGWRLESAEENAMTSNWEDTIL